MRSFQNESVLFAIPHLANVDRNPPLKWWRTRPPVDFCDLDPGILRRAVAESVRPSDISWCRAINTQVEPAIEIAKHCMTLQKMSHPVIDIALSAVLAFAIEGNKAARAAIANNLRSRARVDPYCRRLSNLWLDIEGCIRQ